MKRRGAEILFFLIGLLLFSFLVERFGVGNILDNVRRAGISLLLAVGIWFLIYLLNTTAWKLTLGAGAGEIGFLYLFMVTVSGFILNYITPVVALGGEPYKVKKLSSVLGTQRALPAVVLYRMVHLLGHMTLLLAGIILAVSVLSLPMAVIVPLSVIALLIGGIILITLAGNRNGVFQWFHGILGSLRFLPKVATALDGYRHQLEEMDGILTQTYNKRRGSFFLAIGIEFASRALMGVEMYVILSGVGVPVTLASAIFIFVMYSIAINVLFFVPMNVGAREGGIYLGLESLSLAPLMSIYFGIVMRIREFIWILIGLLFILITPERKPVVEASN